MMSCCIFFFFCQAEDGIRDLTVTGVQTCALPILRSLMKPTLMMMGIAMLIAGIASAPDVAQAQQPGTKRTDLQRHDLSVPGREVIQVRVDFDPGYVAPRHTHPGEEIIYVIEGTLEYYVEGRPPTTYKAGDVLIVPYGTVHSV